MPPSGSNSNANKNNNSFRLSDIYTVLWHLNVPSGYYIETLCVCGFSWSCGAEKMAELEEGNVFMRL